MASVVGLISGSVGVAAKNLAADVKRVQGLLNFVPAAQGGPAAKLVVDGLCGPLTCGAIKTFQGKQLGFADGRIDPGQQTLQKLVNLLEQLGLLLAALNGAAPSAPVQGGAPSISTLREGIKTWALLGVNGPLGDVGGNAQHGVVSDLDKVLETLSWGGTRSVRRGWKNLKRFFDETVEGWTEQHWKMPGYLDGVKVPGKRVPQPGKDGVSWCGIFATWCWIQAGKQTKWRIGLGPSNATKVAGNQGIQVGDICVQKGAEVHHFIAIDVSGDTHIEGVNGNSSYQSVLQKPMPRDSIQYYYRPD